MIGRKPRQSGLQQYKTTEEISMTRTLIHTLGMLALAAGLLVTSPCSLRADDAEGRRCNNATLKGDYGFHATGIRNVPGAPGQTEMHATMGLRSYDGKGALTGLTLVTQGQVTGVRLGLPSTGTYEVNPDCTGKITIYVTGVPAPIEAAFVIVDKGREIKEVPTSPGGVGVALLQRK
jgi:hypothetical protein